VAVYWHPFLVQLLRDEYGDLLEILDEVLLGRMPPRLDMVIIRRDPQVALPFPFCYLGPITVVEFKGPDEIAGQPELVKLEGYSLLYQYQQRYWERSDLTLWLAASRFSPEVLRPGGACLQAEREVGTGVIGGVLDGFPTFLLNLDVLDLNEATLPLKMVSRGPHERDLMEFVVDRAQLLARYVEHLPLLHATALKEVLKMRKINPEQIGLEVTEVIDLWEEEQVIQGALQLWGLEKVVEALGPERAIEALGPERAIEALGPERAIEALGRTLGKARLRALLEQMDEELDEPDSGTT